MWKWLIALCAVSGAAALWWCLKPVDPVRPAMVRIPGGNFQMGNQSVPKIGDPDELPVHTVRVSEFFIGNCEVTKAEWDAVCAWGLEHGFTDLPEGGGKGPDHPVHSVSWHDTVKWCNARSLMEGLKPCYTGVGEVYQTGVDETVSCDWSANGYRLPTEAEWEKAARGGRVGKNYPWGDSISHKRANYCENVKVSKMIELWNMLLGKIAAGRFRSRPPSGYHPTYAIRDMPYTSPVGSFPANGYGLHDMVGNVWEWCWDCYGDYPASLQIDPRGTAAGTYRVSRGGSWSTGAYDCLSAFRGYNYSTNSDTLGFRIARSSVPTAGGQERSGGPGRGR